jgi:homoserine dehydrogenase
LYEASVGGGIPVIRSIREALASDRIHALYGIINGTTNYILTRMSEDQRPFDSVLEEAVRDGYAEADPSFDVDGIDAAQKLAILSTLAFGTRVTPADIYTEGIRQVTPFDVAAAAEMGHVIKLLAIAQKSEEGLDVRVHPALVPDTNLLSHVTGVYNAVLVDCHAIGVQLYFGRGAGMMPTAGAVVSDVIEVGRAIMQGRHGRLPGFGHHLLGRPDLTHIPIEETYSRYYLCYEVVDRPGVLGQIASILGDLHVSIAEMKQSASETPRGVPITMLTHDAREGAVVEAIKLIDQLEVTVAPTRKLRVAPEVPQ